MQLSLPDFELEIEPTSRLTPVEELEVLKLEHRKKLTIGRDLRPSLKVKVDDYLSRKIDVFAWKVEDMPGMDLEIVVHKLNISPATRLFK